MSLPNPHCGRQPDSTAMACLRSLCFTLYPFPAFPVACPPVSRNPEEVQGARGDDHPVPGGASRGRLHPGLHTQAHRPDNSGG